jgi:putative membrane protein
VGVSAAGAASLATAQRRASVRRVADGLWPAAFVGHVALIILSTAALTTFLAGPPPAWLQQEPNATALRIGWTFSGPTYVVLGALAALAHASGRIGVRRAALLAVAGAGISLGAELVGTTTGFPFGAYAYTPLLGWRVAGHVPFPIPLSWFYMLYACLALAARLLSAADTGAAKLRWALAAGAMLTTWDIAMDPAMVRTAHWVWRTPGFFYGMPLTNWIGWLLTGTLIARVMLAIVPPTAIARAVAPSRFPALLYLANGVMPVALCLRYDLWWGAMLGALGMAGIVTAAWTRGRTQG